MHFEESQPAPDVQGIRRSAARWRWVLGVTVLLMTTLIWATWVEIATHERRQALDAAARRQGNLLVSVGQYLARALGNADAVDEYLSGVHASPGMDFRSHLVARARANRLFSAIGACFEDGTVLSAGAAGEPPGLAQLCAGWLAEAPAGARTYPARPVRAFGSTLVPLLTRLPRTHGRPAGVIALLTDVRSLLGPMQEYSVPDETVVVVAGPGGEPLARWHSAARMSQQRAPEAALIPAVLAAGTLGQVHEIEGHAILASARRMDGYPLTILVGTSVADTLVEPRGRSVYYGIACAVATLLIAAFALLLLRLQNHATRSAESLGRARQRLQALNAELEGEVRARTGELETAYQDLEAFSYTVAHDVRAPLAAIRGFAEALQPAVEGADDARWAHYLRRILANASQMNEFTESLLALGKLSRPPVALARIDLSAMAHDVLAGLRERETGHRSVEANVQEGLAVQGDRVLVRQVLENLLGNAWKFSAARAPAVILVERVPDEEGWTTIAIRDNGEGFDSASAVDVFKPFRRMHAPGEFPGTGIGLAAVERIVRLHGGRTWIESSPQQGTSVFFRLRADEPAAS